MVQWRILHYVCICLGRWVCKLYMGLHTPRTYDLWTATTSAADVVLPSLSTCNRLYLSFMIDFTSASCRPNVKKSCYCRNSGKRKRWTLQALMEHKLSSELVHTFMGWLASTTQTASTGLTHGTASGRTRQRCETKRWIWKRGNAAEEKWAGWRI